MPLRWACAAVLGVMSAAAQESPGSITGTVVDAIPLFIPNATVTILSPVERAISADAAGNFNIAGLAPGTYKLRVQAPGFVSKGLEIAVESDRETSLVHVTLEVKAQGPCVGSPRKPRISAQKLPAGGNPQVTGSARLETGLGLSDPTLTLLLAGTSKIIAETSTGKNGKFQFEDVKPGEYDIEASFETSTYTKVRNLRVRDHHVLEVRLTWADPGLCF